MKPPHLLLVDDELHILKAAEFKFKRKGYHVECARDGQEAWEKVLEHIPDVVVTDLQMPRMNGLQFIRHLRSDPRFHHLPTILLTAKGFELDHDEIISKLAVFEIVSKPFSPRDLCKRVEMALAQTDDRRPPTELVADPPTPCFVTDQSASVVGQPDVAGTPPAHLLPTSETP